MTELARNRILLAAAGVVAFLAVSLGHSAAAIVCNQNLSPNTVASLDFCVYRTAGSSKTTVVSGWQGDCLNDLRTQIGIYGPTPIPRTDWRAMVNASAYEQYAWVSAAGQPYNNDSITVSSSTTTPQPVGLQINEANFLCENVVMPASHSYLATNNRVTSTNYPHDLDPVPDNGTAIGDPNYPNGASRYQQDSFVNRIVVTSFEGISTGSLGVTNYATGTNRDIRYLRNNNSRYWFSNTLGFTYTPPSPLQPGVHTVTLDVYYRSLATYHNYTTSGTTRCTVKGTTQNIAFSNWASCDMSRMSVPFDIKIPTVIQPNITVRNSGVGSFSNGPITLPANSKADFNPTVTLSIPTNYAKAGSVTVTTRDATGNTGIGVKTYTVAMRGTNPRLNIVETTPAGLAAGTYCRTITVTMSAVVAEYASVAPQNIRACVVIAGGSTLSCSLSQSAGIIATHEAAGSISLVTTGIADGPISVRVAGYGSGGSNITLTGSLVGGRVTLNLPNADHAGSFAVTITSPQTVDCQQVTVYNLPYFQVFGASIRAGGNFGGGCTGGGALASWFNNTDSTNGYGSNTNLAAIAMVAITGVASYQNVRTNSTTGVSFANNIAADKSINIHSPKLGGNYDTAGSYCLPQVEEPDGTVDYSGGSIAIGAITGPKKHTGALVINGGSVATKQVGSMFVYDGDVYIDASGISYATGWTDIQQIPSFTLSVTGGNIYISKDAVQLDGVFIAKKNAVGKGGSIFTCATGINTPVLSDTIYSDCNKQLTVHGSFVANKINFMRSYGTLQDGSAIAPASCVNGVAPTGRKTCAAEVFDFSPEVYLVDPAVKPPSNGALRYDSIITLPPIL